MAITHFFVCPGTHGGRLWRLRWGRSCRWRYRRYRHHLRTITGFGSVFVNGVEFDTSGAGFDVDDNPAAMESDLGIGMVVAVTGTVNNDGITGSASLIEYDEAIEGPIAADPVEDADGVTKTWLLLSSRQWFQCRISRWSKIRALSLLFFFSEAFFVACIVFAIWKNRRDKGDPLTVR